MFDDETESVGGRPFIAEGSFVDASSFFFLLILFQFLFPYILLLIFYSINVCLTLSLYIYLIASIFLIPVVLLTIKLYLLLLSPQLYTLQLSMLSFFASNYRSTYPSSTHVVLFYCLNFLLFLAYTLNKPYFISSYTVGSLYSTHVSGSALSDNSFFSIFFCITGSH